jgi:hypothetical protein
MLERSNEGEDFSKESRESYNHLMDAVKEKKVGEILAILEKNKDFSRRLLLTNDEKSKTNILHIAASIEDNGIIIKILCLAAKKAEIISYASMQDSSGSTAGHYAVEAGFISNFKVLANHGLNTRIQRNSDKKTVTDIIKSKYENDETIYLLFMKALVLSDRGKAYFSRRHSDVDPTELKHTTLLRSLQIDKIADHSTDAKLHLRALNDCLSIIESKKATLEEIKLKASHLYAIEDFGMKEYPAIDIARIYDAYQAKEIKVEGLALQLLSEINPIVKLSKLSLPDDLTDEKKIEAAKIKFIEGKFLLAIAQHTENEHVKKQITCAAFGKYFQMEPVAAFSGLRQIKLRYIFEHDGIESEASKVLTASAIGLSYLKVHLQDSQRSLKYWAERMYQTTLDPDDHPVLNPYVTGIRNIESALIHICILDSIIPLFWNFGRVEEISKSIESMGLVINEQEIINKIKMMIQENYIKEITSINLGENILNDIHIRLSAPFSVDNINKITQSNIPKIRSELLSIFKTRGLIVDFEENQKQIHKLIVTSSQLAQEAKKRSGKPDEAQLFYNESYKLSESAFTLLKKTAALNHEPAIKMLAELDRQGGFPPRWLRK